MTKFEDHLSMVENFSSDIRDIPNLSEIIRRLNGLQRKIFEEVEKRNASKNTGGVKHTSQTHAASGR